MQKATTDDIGAICSRIDAQTVIMIKLATKNDSAMVKYYKKEYDRLAEQYRKDMVY